MAGYSKCAGGETCSLRFNCHRYLVKPTERQSYFIPPSIGKDCEYYVPNRSDYMLPFSGGNVGQPKAGDDS